MKRCNRKNCSSKGKRISLKNFYKNDLKIDGYEGACKECRLKDYRKRRDKKKMTEMFADVDLMFIGNGSFLKH